MGSFISGECAEVRSLKRVQKGALLLGLVGV